MRLFVIIDDEEVAAFSADAAPRVGEAVWIKTLDGHWTFIVESVEHQFDRSNAENYAGHDVLLYCKRK